VKHPGSPLRYVYAPSRYIAIGSVSSASPDGVRQWCCPVAGAVWRRGRIPRGPSPVAAYHSGVRSTEPDREPDLSSVERRILVAGLKLMPSGRVAGPDRLPSIGYGTLYRALDRLERMGYLASWWAEPVMVEQARRRMYELTPAGVAAAALVPSPAIERRARVRVTACT